MRSAGDRQPWIFRYRMMLSFAAYFGGFFLGYAIDALMGGSGAPSFIALGRRWGEAGIRTGASIAAGFAFAGFLIRWWASSYHRAGVVFDTALHGERLTVSGPYRFLRNPLYLGSLLQAVGIGALGPPAALALVIVFASVLVYRLIALEETYLRQTQGRAYADYCAAVPRLLPRLSSAGGIAVGERPNWLLGLSVELGTLGFAVTLAYIAIFLPRRGDAVFAALLYASFALLFFGALMSRAVAARSAA